MINLFSLFQNYKLWIISVLAFAVGFGACRVWDASQIAAYRVETAKVRETHSQYVITSQNALIQAQNDMQEKERKIHALIQQVDENAADHARLIADYNRLRDDNARLRDTAKTRVAGITNIDTAKATAGVLAHVLGLCAESYSRMAEIAEESLTKGAAVERVYSEAAK